jgi:UDP-N-acetylglucosamine--N-acetylmuramyl-(pentapeptide) pyrophosphoryl-undecaprenol N-acetylglucosamine transferase
MSSNDHNDIELVNTLERPVAQRMRILVSGGGTGGHIYPALAVARELQQHYGAEILYLGDADGLETRLVPEAGFTLVTVHAGRLHRYWSARTVRDLARVPVGFLEARRHLRAFGPHAVFTSGGYVAVPAGVAARRLGVPLLIHQQDVPPNLANRILRPMANRITVSFEDSLAFFPKQRTRLVGNPVREAVLAVAGSDPRGQKRALGFSPAFPLLVVTGGSQGARHINEATIAALPNLLERFQVLHISGQYTYDETRAAAEDQTRELPPHVGERYRLVAYLSDEMPIALAAADAVIARSGAATLAELAVLGKPSILIPLPPGFGGSPQESNAATFARHGAAHVLLDKHLTGATLLAAVSDLFAAPEARIQMAQAARAFARPHAARDLAIAIVGLAQAYIEERRKQMVLQAIQKASR